MLYIHDTTIYIYIDRFMVHNIYLYIGICIRHCELYVIHSDTTLVTRSTAFPARPGAWLRSWPPPIRCRSSEAVDGKWPRHTGDSYKIWFGHTTIPYDIYIYSYNIWYSHSYMSIYIYRAI